MWVLGHRCLEQRFLSSAFLVTRVRGQRFPLPPLLKYATHVTRVCGLLLGHHHALYAMREHGLRQSLLEILFNALIAVQVHGLLFQGQQLNCNAILALPVLTHRLQQLQS